MTTVDYKMNPFSGSIGETQDLTVGVTVEGTSDFDEAKLAVASFVPPRLGPLYLQNIRVSPISPISWDGDATYGPRKPRDQATFSIEIGTTNTHATQSLATVASYARPGDPTPPNFRGAVGVTKDGVEGVDLNIATMTWSEHHLLSTDQVTSAYVLTVFHLTARMNASQFRIFAPGEALLLGATLQQSAEREGFTADFRWVGSPNATNIPVGGITVAEKLGHDYLWVLYRDGVSNGATVKIPKNVFIERVYSFGDFDELRLPDPT